MKRLVLYLCIILSTYIPHAIQITADHCFVLTGKLNDKPEDKPEDRSTKHIPEQNVTSMEALDVVKEYFAANFEKVYTSDTYMEYYYRLPFANYYLVYEGGEESEKEYVFHLYEFVIDEPDTGIGHVVTYGWYRVDKASGVIVDQIQY